jgi:Mn2+/Fe2+ NRAMP family transporter
MISSIGVVAIVTDVIREWSRPLTGSGDGWNTIVIALVVIPIMVYMVIEGRYRSMEKILALFVGLMGVSFVLTAFMVIPDPVAVMRGLVPNIPAEDGAALIVTGMLGTTMGGVLYVVRSVTVKQKQWSINELKIEKRDAAISAGLMFLLSAAVMACAAGTLFPLGLRVDNAIDMLRLLEPLAGRFAISVFVVGIVSAGLSSLFPHYMLVPMLLSDYRREHLDLGNPRNRAIIMFYALLGFVVPVFGGSPVLVMIASQAFTLTVTPLVILLMFLIANKPNVMGGRRYGWVMNCMLVISFLFSVVMSVIGALALAELF